MYIVDIHMSFKSTWWSVTAFNDDIVLLEATEFPEFVAKVHGGREACPKSGRIHFQGAIQCRRQVRRSQLKAWLPTAHLEPAIKPDRLKEYALKEETAVGEKKTVDNPVQHISMEVLMMKMAEHWDEEGFIEDWKKTENTKLSFKSAYWKMVNEMLTMYPQYRKVCQLFARSDTISLWEHTRPTWLAVAEGYSITPPQVAPPAENIIVAPSIEDGLSSSSSSSSPRPSSPTGSCS